MLDDFINDAISDFEKPSLFDTPFGDMNDEAIFRVEFILFCLAVRWEVARIAAVIQNNEYADEQTLQKTICKEVKILCRSIREVFLGLELAMLGMSVQDAATERIHPPAANFQLCQQRLNMRFKEAKKILDSLHDVAKSDLQC